MSILKTVVTRFRAYQLGVAGSSFSYFAGGKFTLIEAMATDLNKVQILAEMKLCGKESIDVLHITSWDQDHCSQSGLEWILEKLRPTRIEMPGYAPHTDSGKSCRKIILDYRGEQAAKKRDVITRSISPEYINGLNTAEGLIYDDIYYHPRAIRENSNDNSTIKFFRKGAFNVLSLGDVEHSEIAALLKRCTKILCKELDVMILAHHGADNGFTTKNLLEKLSPSIAICSSNYDNQFEHPRPEIREMLYKQGIPIYTTKTGDVLISSIGGHTMDYQVTNFISETTKTSSSPKIFRSRKSKYLRMNMDSIKNLHAPARTWPKR